MLLPRLEPGGDVCPSGSSSCAPASAITGSSDPDAPTAYDDGYNPNYNNSGPQRYIGIVMVAVIALLIFIYWVYQLSRRKLQTSAEGENQELYLAAKSESQLSKPSRSWFHLGRGRTPHIAPPSPVPLAPYSADPEKDAKYDLQELQFSVQSAQKPPKTPAPTRMISEAEKNRRRMLDASTSRGKVVKEVSGGMVIYTTTREPEVDPSRSPTVPERAARRSSRRVEREQPRGRRRSPVRGRSVDLNAEWRMEHVHGVRYEARTPPER